MAARLVLRLCRAASVAVRLVRLELGLTAVSRPRGNVPLAPSACRLTARSLVDRELIAAEAICVRRAAQRAPPSTRLSPTRSRLPRNHNLPSGRLIYRAIRLPHDQLAIILTGARQRALGSLRRRRCRTYQIEESDHGECNISTMARRPRMSLRPRAGEAWEGSRHGDGSSRRTEGGSSSRRVSPDS